MQGQVCILNVGSHSTRGHFFFVWPSSADTNVSSASNLHAKYVDTELRGRKISSQRSNTGGVDDIDRILSTWKLTMLLQRLISTRGMLDHRGSLKGRWSSLEMTLPPCVSFSRGSSPGFAKFKTAKLYLHLRISPATCNLPVNYGARVYEATSRRSHVQSPYRHATDRLSALCNDIGVHGGTCTLNPRHWHAFPAHPTKIE